ncbi:hypothetical protein [Nocardia miyunensis]|uniref:hypothetical protein n=1 Tax=Nocardia miyunensis TaxID=282684 RepID=UPI0012F524F0|nr:hypothetical protein [Nocardia miyunensis]
MTLGAGQERVPGVDRGELRRPLSRRRQVAAPVRSMPRGDLWQTRHRTMRPLDDRAWKGMRELGLRWS